MATQVNPRDLIPQAQGTYAKIIHQTYKTSSIPENWQISQDKWIEYHPGFVYVLWTDEDLLWLMTTHFPQYLSTFNSFKFPIMKVDYGRTFVLYEYGGTYADLDVVPKFDHTYYADFFKSIPQEIGLAETSSTVGKYKWTNYFMMAKVKSVWWRLYWDFVKTEEYLNKSLWYKLAQHNDYFHVLFITGPTALSNVVLDNAVESRKYIHTISRLMIGGQQGKNTTTQPEQTYEAFMYHIDGDSWGHSHGVIHVLYHTYCYLPWILCAILVLMLTFFVYKYMMCNKQSGHKKKNNPPTNSKKKGDLHSGENTI